MKKAIVISSFLLSILGHTVPMHAAQQESGPEIKQKVSKTARKAAVQAKVVYHGAPHFVSIEGTSIGYATNAPEAVLKIGGAFYFAFTYYNPSVLDMQNVWLVSASAQGRWVPADSVPKQATEIVCAQLNSNAFEPYQLCALPWGS